MAAAGVNIVYAGPLWDPQVDGVGRAKEGTEMGKVVLTLTEEDLMELQAILSASLTHRSAAHRIGA